MRTDGIGISTLRTRVESWECDFNGHWNARFYSAGFQMAAERVATLGGGANPGAGACVTRHIRYHRELFVGAAVGLRSARIAEGAFAGAVLHLLSGEEGLSATAIDLPGTGAEQLPAAPADVVRIATPRAAAQPVDWSAAEPAGQLAEVGPVRPAELDHAGALRAEEIIRRVAYGLHGLLSGLGFTRAFETGHGIGRMAVETRTTRLGPCAAGDLLRARSRVAGVGRRSFATRHRLETTAGAPVAEVAHRLVTVDLTARRAVDLPDFLRALRSDEAG
ncbi:MAG: hypothetical protein DI556_07955 [Rhodovulum sulfidophilum]|uniref:Thioesterase n=1 Tax=Rhodovulum sulfidophilum TaxID=35806 RepID=A0A2W5NAE2_RHOSU|nr:MAG: hypothetical protein DI556_07955 [Rhodovulum sulfidophilum]